MEMKRRGDRGLGHWTDGADQVLWCDRPEDRMAPANKGCRHRCDLLQIPDFFRSGIFVAIRCVSTAEVTKEGGRF
ncbi:hypothetical protein L1987_24749 [Smallanthus sonchifolius]|uniref:Uncharacterized protein n=1 Tax=Smallanthus sonchifolius TaxID=185202 RepID=A0ACB9IMM9_9ASTR|nr:hypothetical protein L1987_24749 [Smallanthus sonchifolius]